MTRRFHTLVVGAGPAGIAAAVSAAEAGSHVALIDDNPEPGCQIWRADRGQPGPSLTHAGPSPHWRTRLLASSVTRLQGWSVFDSPEPMTLRAERNGHAVTFSADRIVLATGARERFLPFPGWTLPNVMGVGGLQAMVKSGLPIAGKRVVLAGSGPLLLVVAAYLRKHGAHVSAICEQASWNTLAGFALGLVREPGKLGQAFALHGKIRGVPFWPSTWPVRALGR